MHNRDVYSSEHELFRTNVRRFFRTELEPNIDQWEEDGLIPRDFWLKAGEQGFLCCGMPEKYGGPGADFFYNAVFSEDVGFALGGASVGVSVQAYIWCSYLLKSAREQPQQS